MGAAMTGLAGGYTTGSCAAAAAKAAALLACHGESVPSVSIPLADGTRCELPLLRVELIPGGAWAAVLKNGGDDPDITTGVEVRVELELTDSCGISFSAGEGVGTVTLPGLSVPVGEPAINPGPRRMIAAALAEVTPRGARVRISIPGGADLACRTFNPRLGIAGGLSILGTTGRVRPFSHSAMRSALRCGLDVVLASGIHAPVFVPGNIGERAARRHLRLCANQVVDVGNEWGEMLDYARQRGVAHLAAVGHPGKLAKLWLGDWDTHSARSSAAVDAVRLLADVEPFPTVEGVFMSLDPVRRSQLAVDLSARIRAAVVERLNSQHVAVGLVNMAGDWLGETGDFAPWR
jgi:cobalt-precorrin-5B (C1)-methyltransferase